MRSLVRQRLLHQVQFKTGQLVIPRRLDRLAVEPAEFTDSLPQPKVLRPKLFNALEKLHGRELTAGQRTTVHEHLETAFDSVVIKGPPMGVIAGTILIRDQSLQSATSATHRHAWLMSSHGPSHALFYFSRLMQAKVRHFACVRWLRPLQPGRDRDSRCLGMTSWVPLESGVASVGILALGDVAGRGIVVTTSDDDGAILWAQTAPISKMQEFPTQVGENLEVDLAGEDGATD